MMIKDAKASSHAIAWGLFLGAYAVLFGVTLFFGKFVDADWDIRLLLFLNPDHYIPVLDELIIFQTDWAGFYLGIFFLAWLIGYYSTRNSAPAQRKARVIYCVLAVVFGVWYGMGMFIQDRGIFWWDKVEYPMVFLPLGLVLFTGLTIIGNLFVRLSNEDQQKLTQAFWLTLIALFFVNIIGEDNIKALVQRHRPLHETYAAWNGAVRIIPDEIVRGSYSYISGHTSSFWAQTVVFFWLIKSWRFRSCLVALGLFHGFTRIYTAAHFPYCVLMATLFGFSVTSLVYYCFWNHRQLPLTAMLLLSGGLFMLGASPKISIALLVVTLVWYAAYWYLHRGKPEPAPVNDAICMCCKPGTAIK